MTALQDYLTGLGACEEAVAWAAPYPDLASAWAACERRSWMIWLLDRLGAWTAPAWAEYERVGGPARAEYERATAPARAEYERARDSALAEYYRVMAPAWAEFERAMAAALRSIYPIICKMRTA